MKKLKGLSAILAVIVLQVSLSLAIAEDTQNVDGYSASPDLIDSQPWVGYDSQPWIKGSQLWENGMASFDPGLIVGYDSQPWIKGSQLWENGMASFDPGLIVGYDNQSWIKTEANLSSLIAGDS